MCCACHEVRIRPCEIDAPAPARRRAEASFRASEESEIRRELFLSPPQRAYFFVHDYSLLLFCVRELFFTWLRYRGSSLQTSSEADVCQVPRICAKHDLSGHSAFPHHLSRIADASFHQRRSAGIRSSIFALEKLRKSCLRMR